MEAAKKAAEEAHAKIRVPAMVTFRWDVTRYEVNAYYECDQAADYRGPAWPVDMVSNEACNRRAWLHENIDKTGHDVCIGPLRDHPTGVKSHL